MLPPIHPGLYPPSPSPSLKNTTHNCSHVIPSPPKPNTLHKDFRQMNDLIDYEELCHTVETQLKHDRLNPPQPIRHTMSASRKQLPPLPPHQAYMLPVYSRHVAKIQDNTPIGEEINIDSDSNVPDNYTLDPMPNLLSLYASDSSDGESDSEDDDSVTDVDHTPTPKTDSPSSIENENSIIQYEHEDNTLQMAVDTQDTNLSDVPIIQPDALPSRLPPTIRPIDTANASLPATMSKNWDLMQKSVGHMNMSLVLKHLKTVALDTILVPNLGRSPITDRGEIATLPKRRQNTKQRPRPENIGDTIHYDIAHGTGSAIGGVRYVLVLIDKATQTAVHIAGYEDLYKWYWL